MSNSYIPTDLPECLEPLQDTSNVHAELMSSMSHRIVNSNGGSNVINGGDEMEFQIREVNNFISFDGCSILTDVTVAADASGSGTSSINFANSIDQVIVSVDSQDFVNFSNGHHIVKGIEGLLQTGEDKKSEFCTAITGITDGEAYKSTLRLPLSMFSDLFTDEKGLFYVRDIISVKIKFRQHSDFVTSAVSPTFQNTRLRYKYANLHPMVVNEYLSKIATSPETVNYKHFIVRQYAYTSGSQGNWEINCKTASLDRIGFIMPLSTPVQTATPGNDMSFFKVSDLTMTVNDNQNVFGRGRINNTAELIAITGMSTNMYSNPLQGFNPNCVSRDAITTSANTDADNTKFGWVQIGLEPDSDTKTGVPVSTLISVSGTLTSASTTSQIVFIMQTERTVIIDPAVISYVA